MRIRLRWPKYSDAADAYVASVCDCLSVHFIRSFDDDLDVLSRLPIRAYDSELHWVVHFDSVGGHLRFVPLVMLSVSLRGGFSRSVKSLRSMWWGQSYERVTSRSLACTA